MNKNAIGKKICWLSLFAMIGVVFIHSNTVGTLPAVARWNDVLQTVFTRSFTAWAVPFFFMTSGFWFARGGYVAGNAGGGQIFALKKMRTLLLPYLLWAVIGTAIEMPLIAFNNHVNGVPLFSRTFLDAPDVWRKVDGLLGVTINGPRGNLALWYVRTLLVLFLFAPVWKLMIQRCRWVLCGIAAVCVLYKPDMAIPYLAVKVGSVGWFILGASAADVLASGRRLPRIYVAFAGIGWAAFSLMSAFDKPFLPQLIPVFGIAFLWFGYDWIADRLGEPKWWMKQTFWIYCLHGVIVPYWLSGGYFILGKSNTVSIALMMTGPIFAIGVCLLGALLTKRIAPKVYALLTGGRG